MEKSSQNASSNSNALNKKVPEVTAYAAIGVSVIIFFAVYFVSQG